MKKLIILCVLLMAVSVSPIFALTFSVYESGSSSIDTWINGEQVTVLENFEKSGVPEPATMLLFGTGLAGLASARLRRKKK